MCVEALDIVTVRFRGCQFQAVVVDPHDVDAEIDGAIVVTPIDEWVPGVSETANIACIPRDGIWYGVKAV